jgi:hypothetical protein
MQSSPCLTCSMDAMVDTQYAKSYPESPPLARFPHVNFDDSLSFKKFHFHSRKGPRYSSKLVRAISILDRTTPSNEYKFGLLYLAADNGSHKPTTLEARLLSNMQYSPSFHRFASQLGEIIPTRSTIQLVSTPPSLKVMEGIPWPGRHQME